MRQTVIQLANAFADGVLEAIRGASLEEILGESRAASRGRGAARAVASEAKGAARRPAAKGRRGKGGRLPRRSADDIAGLVDRIVGLLEQHPDGLRAEQIRDELGLLSKELPRPLADALAAKRISRQGQKRATTYFAKSARAAGGRKGRGRKAKAA